MTTSREGPVSGGRARQRGRRTLAGPGEHGSRGPPPGSLAPDPEEPQVAHPLTETPTGRRSAARGETVPLDEAAAGAIAAVAAQVMDAVTAVVQGKPQVARTALTVLLAGGHLLIEDIPGVGKTILARSLAAALGADSRRLQFTPDLLPGDVTGASVLDQATGAFVFRPGAVFTQELLADEINRASPKTQSALLEAMEERRVSVDGDTHVLPEPFMVVATANPVEMEGTYALPEAQRDRFLAQTELGYPAASAEARMIAAQAGPQPPGGHDLVAAISARTSPEAVAAHVRQVRRVHAAPALLDYAVRLAAATRDDAQVSLGASPRATVHLLRAAKAHAVLEGRAHVEPEDLRTVLHPVWGHRLHLGSQALSRGVTAPEVLDRVLRSTAVS